MGGMPGYGYNLEQYEFAVSSTPETRLSGTRNLSFQEILMKLRLLLAFILVAVGISSAQTFRGAIQGTVTDATGASVADAQVNIVSTDTGLKRSAITDAAGNYNVTELPLGNYNVSATKPGFRTQTLKGIAVGVSASQRADVVLTPGKVEETVEVTAQVPLVETTGNTIGGTLDAARVEALPVNGRDFTKLLTLVPGAGADASSVSDSAGSFGIFAINGNRGRSNNYLLDGTDMNDGYRNDPVVNEAGVFGTPATILPVDALAEIGVLSNTEAEYGRNSGGTINMVTKSGTNSLHGSIFEDFRNTKLNARNYFNTTDQAQYPFHNNQFGGALGGPIVKDRTFFFVAYEGQRETGGQPNTEKIPTQAMFNHFFDVIDEKNSGGVGLNANRVRPSNVITNSGINPVIQQLLARNPWALAGGADAFPVGTDEFTPEQVTVVNKFSNRVDSFIGKIDQHIGANDLVSGRYFFGNSDQSFPLALGGGSTVPGFNTVTPTTVHLVALSFTHVLSTRSVLEFRGGYNRFVESFKPQDSAFDPSTIGLVTSAGLPSFDFGLPQIRFRGSSGLSGLGGNNSLPRQRVDTNAQFSVNYGYNSGKHNYKLGYQFTRTSIAQNYDLGYRGRLNFTDNSDADFTDFESFLNGDVGGGLQFAGNSRRHTSENNQSVYFQDNYRLTRKLTLNYGMRWDYFGVIQEKNNLFSNFDTATASLVPVSKLYPSDYNNFAPRFSIAYDVGGNAKTVVRAGWGLYYDGYSQDFFLGHFPFNTFNPGSAYNGIGPAAITSGSVAGTPITSGVPIFQGFSPTTDVWTVDQNLRTPYVQNYNLNVQQELTKNASVQIGYVGSTGKKLFRFRDINQSNLVGEFPFPAWTYVNQFESSAVSNYNALQTVLNIRGFHGLSSQVIYTWSHSIDTASDGEDFVPNAAQPDNSYNPRAEKANSNFDGRHRFSMDFSYELPSPKEYKLALGGWSLNGILRLATGEPYNLNSFESFNNSGEFFERPDVIGNPYAGTGGPSKLLNLGAFAAPCEWDPVANFCSGTGYHYGNLGRNAFVGPSFKNLDFSIAKKTKVGEKVTVLFRADIFNLLNHPNFSNPLLPNFAVDLETNGAVSSDPNNSGCNTATPNFAQCRGIGQGFLPATVTPDVGIGNPFLGGGGSRNVQLGLKVIF